MHRSTWVVIGLVVLLVVVATGLYSQYIGVRSIVEQGAQVLGPDVLILGEPAIVSWSSTEDSKDVPSVKIEFCFGPRLFGEECITLNPDTPNDGKAQVFVPSTIRVASGYIRVTTREHEGGDLIIGQGGSRSVTVSSGTRLLPGEKVVINWNPIKPYREVKIEFCVPEGISENCQPLAHRVANTGTSPQLVISANIQRQVGVIRVRARNDDLTLVTQSLNGDDFSFIELPAAIFRPAQIIAGGGDTESGDNDGGSSEDSGESNEGAFFEEDTSENIQDSGGTVSQDTTEEAADVETSTEEDFSLGISDIEVSSVTDASFTVSFNTSPAADIGSLYVRKMGDTTWNILDDYPAPSSTFTYTVTGLDEAQEYEYMVFASATDPECESGCNAIEVQSEVFQVTTTDNQKPDLITTNVATSIETYGNKKDPKYRLYISARVENQGEKGSGSSRTRVEYDEDSDGDIDSSFSSPTQELGITDMEDEAWQINLVPIGNGKVEVCADVLGQVDEADETNNCVTVQVEVVP